MSLTKHAQSSLSTWRPSLAGAVRANKDRNKESRLSALAENEGNSHPDGSERQSLPFIQVLLTDSLARVFSGITMKTILWVTPLLMSQTYKGTLFILQ